MTVDISGLKPVDLTEKQENILQKAISLFYKKGYVATSIRDITGQLGIKASSIYAHIQSKEQIFDWLALRVLNSMLDNYHKLQEFDGGPKERFLLSTKLHLEMIQSCPKSFDVFYTNVVILKNFEDLPNAKKYHELYMASYQYATEMIVRYFESMGIENSSRFPDIANFAMMVINNVQRWKNLETESLDEIAQFLHDALVFGVKGENR